VEITIGSMWILMRKWEMVNNKCRNRKGLDPSLYQTGFWLSPE